MRSTIKVLVVDDSALIRQMLTRAISLDPRIEVVGVAKTGVEAIQRAMDLGPDVITLDIEMPELSGLDALPHLRKHTSARVIMLSSLDHPDTTYQALSLGAVDFISKPKGGVATSLNELSELLVKKIKTAYRIDPERIEAANTILAEESTLREAPPAGAAADAIARSVSVGVAIAASTGGPPALERVFAGLTPALPAAYFIVQHLPAGFSASLAKRLRNAGTVDVVEAVHGGMVHPGTAYVAPHGSHMTIAEPAPGQYKTLLEEGPPLHGVRPAADPLFSSVAHVFREHSVGVVLTGMGADGARGLVAIREVGGGTIAQNEETSVVWGMPGAAARTGAVRHLVPIGLVAAEIRRSVRGGRAA